MDVSQQGRLLKRKSKEKRGNDYYDKLNTCRETVTTVSRGGLIKTTNKLQQSCNNQNQSNHIKDPHGKVVRAILLTKSI